MKKFDHLFSIDPIGAFEKIEQDYARYFEAAYRMDNASLNRERMDTLKSGENMSKEPYIEVLPEYSPAAGVDKMDDLVSRFAGAFGSKELARMFFEDFIAKGLMQGLMDKYLPYGHQIGMMEKVFAGTDDKGRPLKYRNTVITSGTGSGKTEAFLLPLFADIFKECQEEKWAAAADYTDWHVGEEGKRSRRYTPRQREGDQRPAGIRAIVLYPMNALVEDQMARLREALDSDAVRKFMCAELGNNRIYFGSYNGATIAPKSYALLQETAPENCRKKREEVAKQLEKLHRDFEFVQDYVRRHPDKTEALYISPRLGGEHGTSEMVTRWDMQKWAPDIMITNISMLSVMLMRRAEEQMFSDTRSWLAAEDLPDNEREEAKRHRIFHVVVDELHLYRGTAGSEVACLLRMLYHAIGLEPVVDDGCGHKVPNPQLRILAASASLGDENETQRFMEEFFGIYSTVESENVFNVQHGQNYVGADRSISIDYTKFAAFTHENFVATDDDAAETGNRRLSLCNDFVSSHFGCHDLREFCGKYQEQLFWDFYQALPQNSDGRCSKRPISQTQLMEKLFGNNEAALRGFFLFRGYVDTQVKNHKLPRFRFHKFFKYIEGLWGVLNPALTEETPPVTHLSYAPKEIGSDNRKVLELLRCENCGRLFIGGNRKRNKTDGSVSLTLNFPNLDQIPNFNPTPIVQNKTYRDYAIFWPQDMGTEISLPGGMATHGGADHVVVISSGDCAYRHGKARWMPGYLDAVTGRFTPKDRSIDSASGQLKPDIRKNGIQGFLYRVVDEKTGEEIDDLRAGKIYAAPCTCPYCLQDYTLRKYTNSPIRSFRTGIDRSNQILSKELLYQLDERSAKLIGFSDSREDAAKQALGIEREQYRDMVRMLFVECVNEAGIEDIISFIKQELEKGTKKRVVRKMVHEKWRRPDIEKVTDGIFDAIDDDDWEPLEVYRQNNVPLSQLIGDGFSGMLVRKLLQLGINPAGEAFKYQWYRKDNSDEVYHWSAAYDFKNCRLVESRFKDDTYSKQIRRQLENAVFANSFGKYMGVSVLDAGIGYICGPQSDAIQASPEYRALRELLSGKVDVYEFVDAFIRVMGDNYLYPDPDNEDRNSGSAADYGKLKAAVRKPVREFCRRSGTDEAALGEALVKYLRKYCTDSHVLSLELGKLSFARMARARYLKCPKCGRVHPNMGFGFCTSTSCMTPLDPSCTIDTDRLHEHYISFDILQEKKKPMRLHTEELSGQTDDIQARLYEFKDMILAEDDEEKEGKERTLPIDMLCVTTTMEVGVDIGSLQAIYQGNMPPTRYNYQQRVGRGGRRGQAFSAAFTFCRGRTHDVYYYTKAIDEMIDGIPAAPKLSLAPYVERDGSVKMKKAIMKRVVVKEMLRLAYKDLPYNYQLQDTAGEFGTVGEWKPVGGQGNKAVLENWIKCHQEEIERIVHRYFDQFNVNCQICADIQEIIDWINHCLVCQIDNAVSKTANLEMGLARYLSESGFLPMYGMPSDSRFFYHGVDSAHRRVRSIDRSSEMAISEFAPGAEKTKDKGKYRVEGLTLPIKEEMDVQGRIAFYDESGDALADRYILSFDKGIGEEGSHMKEIVEAPSGVPVDEICLEDSQKLIVIPQAYRSLAISGNTGMPTENQDRGSRFAQVLIFARDNSAAYGHPNKRTVGNVDLFSYELGLNEDPTVWHINNNNGEFYTGAYSAQGLDKPWGERANFLFFDKVGNGICRKRKAKNVTDVALAAKKITEMIKLELRSYPDTLNLSLKTGNRSAIRAAFYSAAFLLQRALADKLDIQPDEIEICEKIDDLHEYPSIYLSDALPNGAGIVSYLYQEGKLEELIGSIVNFDSFDSHAIPRNKSFMQSLVAEEHRRDCLTACQKCLLTYSNRGFHHVLDWRMGVGLLRLMLDRNYDFGFREGDRWKYEEMKDWNVMLKASAEKCRLATEYDGQNVWANDDECVMIYHPLWNREAVKAVMPKQYSSWKMFNTFKLLRSDLTEDEEYAVQAKPQNGSSLLNRIKKTTAKPVDKPVIDDDDENLVL